MTIQEDVGCGFISHLTDGTKRLLDYVESIEVIHGEESIKSAQPKHKFVFTYGGKLPDPFKTIGGNVTMSNKG